MPLIYLSPSTQEFNPYVNGGNEEYYMNLIADAMVPYLEASGIAYVRNNPSLNAAAAINESNEGSYDLHLALHSNAAPPSQSGKFRGTDVYYYPASVNGKRAADIIAENLKDIYLYPMLVKAVPTISIGEVSRTRAPAVLIEFAYHDNSEDANWIKNNITNIAENVVFSLTEYFGIPFVKPSNGTQRPITGYVRTNGRGLYIRNEPSFGGDIIGKIPNGAGIGIISRDGEWYRVLYNGINGFSYGDYIVVE